MTVENIVSEHYGSGGLLDRILSGLSALGVDPANATPKDLKPVDEFHIGGAAATEALVAQLDLAPDARILDIGSGIGGTARHIAGTTGAKVDGLDLTDEFIAVATALSDMVGLGQRTRFHLGSALRTPFADESFDEALLLHVGMNIADKTTLMREAHRVLKPGAAFAVYEVMRMNGDDLVFPLPWADTPASSFAATPEDYRAAARTAGFEISAERERRAYALEFFAKQVTGIAAKDGPPPLGLHLLMGPTAQTKIANMIANIEAGRIAPVEMILRRAA